MKKEQVGQLREQEGMSEYEKLKSTMASIRQQDPQSQQARTERFQAHLVHCCSEKLIDGSQCEAMVAALYLRQGVQPKNPSSLRRILKETPRYQSALTVLNSRVLPSSAVSIRRVPSTFETKAMLNTLEDPRVRSTLVRLHKAAKLNICTIYKVPFYHLYAAFLGKDLFDVMPTSALKSSYLPVSEAEGTMLYKTARSRRAKLIVEFGCSFGISTIYLAAAAKDTGGHVITTEMEPSKCAVARANLKEAGLSEYVDIREGDAMETLKTVPGKIDLLFLDGWKNLYKPLLDMLTPQLSINAALIADNVNFSGCKPFNDAISAPESDFFITYSSSKGTIAYYKASNEFIQSHQLRKVQLVSAGSSRSLKTKLLFGSLFVAGTAITAKKLHSWYTAPDNPSEDDFSSPSL